MKKQIQKINHLILAISLILVPLLLFLTVVSLIKNHLFAGIGYGIWALAWIYAAYQWLMIAKELKDLDEK